MCLIIFIIVMWRGIKIGFCTVALAGRLVGGSVGRLVSILILIKLNSISTYLHPRAKIVAIAFDSAEKIIILCWRFKIRV